MLYFATLKDCAGLTRGHARAAPTSNAKAWIDAFFIRLLSGGQEGTDLLILRARGPARSFHGGSACKQAVRYARVEFRPYPLNEDSMRFTKWTIAALFLTCAIASQAATQQPATQEPTAQQPTEEHEKKLK